MKKMNLRGLGRLALFAVLMPLLIFTSGCASRGHDATALKTQEQVIEDVTSEEAYALVQDNEENEDFVILDVRTPEEYASGHIENAVNMDYYSNIFRDELNKLDKNRTYLIYCGSGTRSGRALEMMKELGFREVYNVVGGIARWKAEGLPVAEVEPEGESTNWKTYTNEEQGYEIKYPADLLEQSEFSCRIPISEKEVVVGSHAVRFFHEFPFDYYDLKGDSHSSLTDISVGICIVEGDYKDFAGYYGDYGLGNPVTIAGRKGFKIEMGAEGEGAEVYYLEKEEGIASEIAFFFHPPFFDSRLADQKEYIPFEKQKQIFAQMLSSFRFLE